MTNQPIGSTIDFEIGGTLDHIKREIVTTLDQLEKTELLMWLEELLDV